MNKITLEELAQRINNEGLGNVIQYYYGNNVKITDDQIADDLYNDAYIALENLARYLDIFTDTYSKSKLWCYEDYETEPFLITNKIKTPDGTILESTHVHDYREYLDKNGYTYMVDGGLEYLRRNVHKDAPYTELSLNSNSSFDKIRKEFERGGRGKDGKQELKYIPLSDMSDYWIINTIAYILENMFEVDVDRIRGITEYEFEDYVSNRKNFINQLEKDLINIFKGLYASQMFLKKYYYYTMDIYLKELKYRIENDIIIQD